MTSRTLETEPGMIAGRMTAGRISTRRVPRTLMRALVISAVAVAAFVGFTPRAEARDRWGVHVGVGSDGFSIGVGYGNRRHGAYVNYHHRYRDSHWRGHHGYRRYGHHGAYHRRHRHVRAPIYARVWIAPVYHSVFIGYDHYGRARYRRVLVTAGHYRNVLRGYRCSTCGAGC